MDIGGKSVRDPAAHQPSKAKLEEDVRIGATPGALAWAATRGGAERRDNVVTPKASGRLGATRQS